MTAGEAFTASLSSLFATELQRQGVPDVDGWLGKIRTYLAYVPCDGTATTDEAASKGGPADNTRVAVHIDFANVPLGDKVVIALCEALVRLSTPSAQAAHSEVPEWCLTLRRCAITDRAVQHLSLLLTDCPSLVALDVSANAFSESGSAALAQAASQVPCDFVMGSGAPPRRSVSAGPERSATARPFGEAPVARAAALSASASVASPPVSALRRSASCSVTSASVTPSRRSGASGSAEALQKRREELLGVRQRSVPRLSPTPEASQEEKKLEVPAPEPPAKLPATPPRKQSPPRQSSPSIAVEMSPGGPAPNPVRQASSPRKGSNEPFPDRTDQLDLTANLSPVLDSVLDLSRLTDAHGRLRDAHVFGDAATVWDILDAYEEAQRQSLMGSGQGMRFRPEFSARLPTALVHGGSYEAITVLNLSKNHLRRIGALPRTLLRLDVSNNDLITLEGVEQCKMLTVLNARRNHIKRIAGLEKNLGMAHLFLGHNEIKVVEGLGHLLLLETLDVTHNKLRTQSSIRMLSLCSALRHLLLRGNPVMDAMTASSSYRPLLRNLCPTLVVVDETNLGPSRLAESAGGAKTCARPPHSVDHTQPPLPSQGRGEGYGDSVSVSSSAFISASRQRSRTAPFASSQLHDGSVVGSPPEMDDRAMSLLHMLSRGVTAPTGYGDVSKGRHAAQHIAAMERAKKEREEKERRSRLTARGQQVRATVIKQLAEDSRRYLEETIVRKMTSGANSTGRAAVESGTEETYAPHSSRSKPVLNSYGGDAFPEQSENPLADVLGFTPLPAKDEEAILRRYTPQPKPKSKSRSPPQGSGGEVRASRPAQPAPSPAARRASHGWREVPATDEIECSPIGKDPQVRGAPSLNTTASFHDGEVAHPAQARGRVDNRYAPPPALPSRDGRRSPSPHAYYRDPAEADATAVFGGAPPDDKKEKESVWQRRSASSTSSVAPSQRGAGAVATPHAYVDPQQRKRVGAWATQLAEDTAAVQAALHTLVTLLHAQRQRGMSVPESSRELPPTFLQERTRCMKILTESGMLRDTQVPMDVVVYHNFARVELEEGGEAGLEQAGSAQLLQALSGGASLGHTPKEENTQNQRASILNHIHLMRDAKTCLRYVVLLMEDGRERLLQQYVDQLKESLMIE